MYARAKQAAKQNAAGSKARGNESKSGCKAADNIANSSAAKAVKRSNQPNAVRPAAENTPGSSSAAAAGHDEPSTGPGKVKLKTGLQKEEMISAALSCQTDVEYPSLAKIVRIFTSSTFTDTREERNGLMKNIYPKLSIFCHERGYEFQVVDMRWGVRDEASEDHMTAELCMRELRECQRLSTGPNFVTFLGQKYGYRPFPPKIDAREFENLLSAVKKKEEKKILCDWFKKDENSVPTVYALQPITSRLPDYTNNADPAKKKEAQDKWWADFELMQFIFRSAASSVLSEEERMKYFWSVTHDEIFNAFLQTKIPDHFLWFNRNIDDLEARSKGCRLAGRFIDKKGDEVDTEVLSLINELKNKKIRSKLPAENIIKYHVKWTDNGIDPEVEEHAAYLKTFQTDFYERVTELITRGIKNKEHVEITDDLTLELIAHVQFAQTKCDSFHGRRELLTEIIKRIEDGVGGYPLVVCGQPGSGKTALMAKCLQLVTSTVSKETSVVIRFIGTTPDSSSIRRLLLSVCEQMLALYPEELAGLYDKTKELTMKEVRDLFVASLQAVSDAGSSLYLFLDSLDQLDDSHKGRNMEWLPLPLPEKIHVVLSVIPDEKFSVVPSLKNRIKEPTCFMDVPQLSSSDVANILNGYLTSASRTLQKPQWQLLQDACSRCAIPLFLKLCVDQAAKWSSFRKIDGKVLQGSVKDVIGKLLERLEKYHGFLLVGHGLGYITASKHGLSQNELEDILSLDDEVLNDVYQYSAPPYRRLPPLLWVRVRADLRDYLTDRGAEGATVMQWYHREFREVAEQRYVSNKDIKKQLHMRVADYFLGKWANGVKKPFVDKKGNHGEDDRLVAPQPFVFREATSEVTAVYNHRKFSELPFHLTLAGDVTTLKQEVLCNFDWLYEKMRATNFDSVMDDFTFAKQQGISDKELDIVSTVFRVSKEGVAADIRQLSIQLSGRLLSVKLDDDMTDIKNLIAKCQDPPFTCLVSKQGFLQPSGGSMITKLLGHSDTICSIAISPDKTRVVSYSNDHTIIVWDMETGLEIRRMKYEPPMMAPDIMCITNDNNNIINSCKMQLEIISIFGPEIEHVLELDHEMYHIPVRICLSPDGTRLHAMTDKSLLIWEVGSWEQTHQLPIASPPPEVFTHSPEFLTAHKNVVIYFRKNTEHFYILDPDKYKTTKKYIAKVKVVEEDPEEMHCYMTTTSTDKLAVLMLRGDDPMNPNLTLKIYNALTGDVIKKFKLELRAVVMDGTHIRLHPKSDGNHVVFPNLSHTGYPFFVVEIDLETGGTKDLFSGSNPFYNVACVDDHRALSLTVTNLHTMEVKSLEDDAATIQLDPDSLVSEEIAVDANNISLLPGVTRYIAGSTSLNEIFVFDLAEQKIIRKLKPNGYTLYGQIHSDTCVIVMNHFQHLVAYDLVKVKELFTLKDFCNYEGGFDSLDKDHIIYATTSKSPSEKPTMYKPAALKNDLLKVLNVYTGKVVKTIKNQSNHPIRWVKVSKNGEVLVCSVNHEVYPKEDFRLVAYDLKANTWLPLIVMGKMENLSAGGGFRVTDDGNHVMFAHPSESSITCIMVWELRKGTGRAIANHPDDTIPQWPMNYWFSESLKSVVILYNGGDVVVYDFHTLIRTIFLKSASQVFMKAHLSDDGALFICPGTTINKVAVWDLSTGERLGTLALDMDMRTSTVSADNNFLFLGGAQIRGMLQIYLHRQERGSARKKWQEIVDGLKKQPAIFGKDMIQEDYFVNPEPPK